MKNSEATTPDRTAIYRGVGLVMVGLGAFLSGAGGVPVDGWNNPFESLPFSVVLGLAFGLSCFGVRLNGLAGMVIFGVACAVLGCVIVDGAMPMWLYPLGLPLVASGTLLRFVNPI